MYGLYDFYKFSYSLVFFVIKDYKRERLNKSLPFKLLWIFDEVIVI